MAKPKYIEEVTARARVAEDNGMFESALVLYRRAYYANKPGSMARNQCMTAMLRMRARGATGMVPGDRHHASSALSEPRRN